MPKISSKNTYYDLTKRFEDTYGNVYDPSSLDLKLWLKANDTVATVGGFPVTRNAATIELNQHISKKQYPAFKKTGTSSLSIADAKDLYFPSTESFTLSMWIYHPPGWTTSSHGFIAKGAAGQDDHEWEVYFVHDSNNGFIALRIWDESQTASVYRIATNLNSGQAQDASSPGWKHWVFTDHSTNTGASSLNDAKIYLNGTALSTSAGTTGTFVESEDLDGTLKIGLGISIAATGAETKFAEIAAWKSELSLTQVKAIYNATKEGVIKGYEQSGFTTQNPRVALQINDNMEDKSYITRDYSLNSRSLIGKSFIDNKFDDTKLTKNQSGKRHEIIKILAGVSLIDSAKLYIRGADGIAFKVFAISSGNDEAWNHSGGLNASDIKVNVLPYLDSIPQDSRGEDATIFMIAQALGDAIQKEASLKLDVSVLYNEIHLKDKNVEKASISSFGVFKPPRAIHHPRINLMVPDGDAPLPINNSNAYFEKQYITLYDNQNNYKKYVLVDGNATAVATGTVLASNTDTGNTTAGSDLVGGIAVNVNLTGGSISTQNALLVQLKIAIEGSTGHNGSLLVENVPSQDNGTQAIDVVANTCYKSEGSGLRYYDGMGFVHFQIKSENFGSVARPVCNVTVADGDGSAPAENSAVTIVTGDGTSKKYVTMTSASPLESGVILNATSDTGASVAGAPGVGAIGIKMTGSTQWNYLDGLRKAITSRHGHGKKIKIDLIELEPANGTQTLKLIDMTSGPYVPNLGSAVRSVTETVAVANVTFSDWSKSGVSGGKIVESILGNNDNKIKVEIVNFHSSGSPVVHGINYSKDKIGKNCLVGNNTLPNLTSSLEPSQGSRYDTHIPLISSGSINPFAEENLNSSFGGSPGTDVDVDRSYITRKGEVISRASLVGPGFEADISSKECITIEIDGSASSNQILYPEGAGTSAQSRPTTAYLNPSTGQWTPLLIPRPADKTFPGGLGNSAPAGSWAVSNQCSERSYVGFGQGQANMFRMISAPVNANGYFIQGSFDMSAESFEREKENFAFIESAHNPCINSFGFPSHPKFAAGDNLSIDMSKYIDEDFLVERIDISAKILPEAPSIRRTSIFDTGLSYETRRSQWGEIDPTGCVFFLLNQRKVHLPEAISQNTFHLESDATGTANEVYQTVQSTNTTIPGWHPVGALQAWGDILTGDNPHQPSNIIYNAGAASTVNGAGHADNTGWSFTKVAADKVTDADFAVHSISAQNRLKMTDESLITTSLTEDVQTKSANTNRDNAPPYYIPIPEGYSTASCLSTSHAYRLRFFGRRGWSTSNTEATYCYVYVYVTYIDKLLGNDPSGVRCLVSKTKVSNAQEIYDIPIRAAYDGLDRKFNLTVKIRIDGTFDDNYFDLRAMEIYKVASSSYVDTCRDIVGWGSAGVFPTNFDDLIGNNLCTKAKDPRDSYALVISSDTKEERDITVAFPPRAPAYGEYGTLVTPSPDKYVITSWDSMGRSGITGMPSDRAPVCGSMPGVESLYMSSQYGSRYQIAQPKSLGTVSPYLLKKTDRIIVGAQSLTGWTMIDDSGFRRTEMMPSKISIKIYGSRISDGKGTFAQTSDNLSSNAVHEVLGNEPVRDQFETEPSYMYEGTYLDNIMFGDPSLTKYLRSGELIDLGIPRSYNSERIGFDAGTYDVGKKKPWGFGRYGDFDPFLPSFQSIASPPATFPTGEKFLVTDQNGLSKIYLSSTAVTAGNPSQNGSDTDTVAGVTADVIRFNNGGNNNFQIGVRQLVIAINHSNGHNGGEDNSKHLMAVESTFESTVTDKRHIIQIIPRVKSRAEADLYDNGSKSITLAYAAGSSWSTTMAPRFEHQGGASLKASGLAMIGHAHQHNWHRRTKDFNRGVINRVSHGSAGITGSFQTFVQLKEDSIYKYDSLVIPTYEFLSMFDVVVPWNQPGTNASNIHAGIVGANTLAFTGSFLPIFQRCQIINQLGGLYTGRSRLGTAGEVSQRENDNGPSSGWDKNIMNLWSRWPFERGDHRSIDALSPTTFRCDVWGASVKNAQPIVRVQVPDMNRLDGDRMSSGSLYQKVGSHFSASLVGFGRGQATWWTKSNAVDGVASHDLKVPLLQGENEWESYSPRENPDVARKTLKALFGFETSHYMRWGNTADTKHVANLGNEYLQFRSRFRDYYSWGLRKHDHEEIADWGSRADIVVRGMRYGIDNYIPTEDKTYMRHNKYGQFRDMLEQRKFHVSCGSTGEALADRPVEIRFVSRPVYDELGKITAERQFNVKPETTNSQNLSLYATASIPYIDEWDSVAVEKSAWKYGRDRCTVQPDADVAVLNIVT